MSDKNKTPIKPLKPLVKNPTDNITTGRITVAPAEVKPPKTK